LNDLERIRAAVPSHISHWQELHLNSYLGGPFDDRSGGLITFEAKSDEQASDAVESDPFVLNDLLETHWLKRWSPK
jgi:uncharacterized protein YciI